MVNTEPYKEPSLFPHIKEWWANVTVAPLDNNITVLSKGSSKGFIGSIPIGGHWAPNSIVGVNALWKNAQKIAIKNNASDTMNNITPKYNPFCTANVWSPKNVASLIISRNQKDIDDTTRNIIRYIKLPVLEKLCIDIAVVNVKANKQALV